MSIDSNLIKKRIVEIEKKLKYIESENTKLELANDYFSLLEILKFIDFNSYNNIQTKEFHAEGKLLQKSSYDFSTDSFNSIMENFYSIVRAIACGAKTNVNIPKRIKKREIPFEIQNMYLKEFLNSFSKNILELYSNLENNIQISNDSKNSSNFKGFCWSQYNPSDNYIIVGNYAITPCLIHELGHAYDSRFCSNIEKLICKIDKKGKK